MLKLFVTGTDTGVGKTHVSCALLKEARRRGWSALGWKPLETGCGPLAEDARALSEASGIDVLPEYALAMPAAPAVAAAREGISIDFGRLVARGHALAVGHNFVLGEGAGGWRVPITERKDMADLAGELGWPVLIVGRAGLGTINHTLLTAEAVARRCALHGVVLSVRPGDDGELAASNRDEIGRRLPCPVWVDPLLVLPPA